jgi:hypothetical protein
MDEDIEPQDCLLSIVRSKVEWCKANAAYDVAHSLLAISELRLVDAVQHQVKAAKWLRAAAIWREAEQELERSEKMKSDRHEAVRVEHCHCERETAKALLIGCEGEEFWIPKSQVLDESEVHGDGDEGDLVIPRWLAESNHVA